MDAKCHMAGTGTKLVFETPTTLRTVGSRRHRLLRVNVGIAVHLDVMAVLSKIVSGGQTGADRAALDFAIEHGIPHGGWCPKGRKAAACV